MPKFLTSEMQPDTQLLSALRHCISPKLWEILHRAAQEAEKRHCHLYLVGGIVRELLLRQIEFFHSLPLVFPDIDLVVDSFSNSAPTGAGIELAKALQQKYPKTRLEIHGQFQTASLIWNPDSPCNSLSLDFATARTETYPYPAANPEVSASSIREDLSRRDFSINAFAVRLTAPDGGKLLDLFNGISDLSNQKLRVLHEQSFIDDPTRMYRGVRFAIRFGFDFEADTQQYIQDAIASGIYPQVLSEHDRVPALQTRLRSELKYTLEAPYWKTALKKLADLNALQCIHPTLKLDDRLWWQMRFVHRCLQRFDPHQTLTHWLILLEVLLASLEPENRKAVALQLQLPAESIERLTHLHRLQTTSIESLTNCQRPSEILRLLNPYNRSNLVLVTVRSPRSIRRKIWQYLTHLSKIKPILNGKDLKQMGYQPGPKFRQILDDLLTATLDGEVGDRSQAEAFLARRYPL